MSAATSLLASFDYLDDAVDAIKELRKAGFSDDLTAYTAYPDHHIEHALGYDQSPVRVFTLVGGLTGTATGFAFPSFASMDWPLITGGKPILSIPAYVIPAFELTVLFGALSTVIGLFILSRLPNPAPSVIYDPEFSAGQYGVLVRAGNKADEARAILEKYQPVELREGSDA
ncbi:MAG: DUF3341 domain-containing protein [Longimicrobiales bacterium]